LTRPIRGEVEARATLNQVAIDDAAVLLAYASVMRALIALTSMLADR
jgi:hypothetical protein